MNSSSFTRPPTSRSRPSLKKGSHLRDEGHQARELTKTLGILDAEGADGAVASFYATG